MHIKKGDTVIVLTGESKRKTSTVIRVLAGENRVIVEGVNVVKRHTRPRKAGEKGGIVEMTAPIHISNVKLAEKKAPAAKKEKTAKKTTKK